MYWLPAHIIYDGVVMNGAINERLNLVVQSHCAYSNHHWWINLMPITVHTVVTLLSLLGHALLL